MKLSRLLQKALAANSLLRKKMTEKTINKKSIATALGAAIVLSGLFYSLWTVPSRINQFPVIDQAQAQELSEKDPYTKEDVEEIICAKPLANSTITDPTLAIYKLDRLCEEMQEREEAPSEELAVDEEERELKEIIVPLLTNTPMEPMIDSISQQEKIVAAFLVGIALKESGMGQHAPRKYGKDCFNYWGYKGSINPTAGGYSCFDSPEHAVEIVGKRLEKFAIDQNRNTPGKMLIWKCGSSCNGHSKKGVQKWVSDVSIYFNKINRS